MTEPVADRAILAWANRTLGAVCALAPLHGGGNSRVLKVSCPDGSAFALKRYRNLPGDPRDRMAVEFGAFERLWEAGVGLVPRPVAASREFNCALYSFIPGRKVESGVEPGDVDQFSSFLGLLKNFGEGDLGREAGNASEAFFTLPDITANLRRRCARLTGRPGAGLAEFLAKRFDPALERFQARAEALLTPGFGPHCLLPPGGRTLSPSDFGFHNALKLPDGALVFLDFEYFGWDDPAKAASDFLLHPRMDLDIPLKARFMSALKEIFPDRPGFPDRIEALLPLFGMAWSLIFLNDFLPGGLERRRFLGESSPEGDILAAQLGKAQAMLSRMEHFADQGLPPYLA